MLFYPVQKQCSENGGIFFFFLNSTVPFSHISQSQHRKVEHGMVGINKLVEARELSHLTSVHIGLSREWYDWAAERADTEVREKVEIYSNQEDHIKYTVDPITRGTNSR